MDCTEMPVDGDLATVPADTTAGLTSESMPGCDSLESDVTLQTGGFLDLSANTPCDSISDCHEEGAELQACRSAAPTGPDGPTAAQVGAHFAAQIARDAPVALYAAARLGPKRVLALLA